MWDNSPLEFIVDVQKDVAEHIADISTDMINGLINKAPVDTSRFVSNINVSLGSPDETYDENKFIGRGGARSAGIATINGINHDNIQSVYFTDVTPYGKYLEGGHSRQAINGVFTPTFLGVAMWYQ